MKRIGLVKNLYSYFRQASENFNGGRNGGARTGKHDAVGREEWLKRYRD
jgi:hypothetical protein